ncbi:MAG TPA: UDP-4-amino-4,6-dideoxy-N-acetyl-beta-L-altrosamine transaminase [Bacteriovoracaceae bacterium]|nr:UDP-4-amino-4,6-dideoxy-N-acetyl-beta-L-altrosamine transaminase [Bacteriovoracaceae bacterium]
MKSIPYGKQEITDEDIKVVTDVLKSEFLTQGPAVLEFEKKFAEYIGSQYAVAVSNGTAALHLCALALGVAPGQKVIVTPITFAASSNCILYCGADVEFVDIDPENYCLDYTKVKALLESAPKGTYAGIVPVDFAGYPINLEKFKALADEHNLWIIEDACHAPGGAFLDSKNVWQKCGNSKFADLAIFSFHPVKHIASGEGGMITTNNIDLYNKLMMLRTHGITKDHSKMKNEPHGAWYYEMQMLGYNYRMPDMLCALGSSQLNRADFNLDRRHKIAARYDKELQGLPIELPKRGDKVNHAFHLYIILTEHRKKLYDFLRSRNIFPQVHYVPVTELPYYREIGYSVSTTPLSKSYYDKCLSIPMFHSMTSEEQTYVIETIKEFFNGTPR